MQLSQELIELPSFNLPEDVADTFTKPVIKTSKNDLGEGYKTAIKNIFKDSEDSSFKEKLNVFNDEMSIFSQESEVFKDSVSSLTATEFMSRVMIMDLFVEMAKGFEAGTAGVLFEYFLANIFGGEVRQVVDAVDFTIGKELGSAKFISPATKPLQSV